MKQMSEVRAFIDTNVLLYLLSADNRKAQVAEALVSDGGTISVQVLNEMTNVARRKLNMPWKDIEEFSGLIQSFCNIESLTIETYKKGVQIANKYQLSVYDAMIIASASLANCDILYTEDMHDGLITDDQLRIANPF